MQTSAFRFAHVFSPCLGLIVWATASFANAAFVPGDFKPNVVDEAHVLSSDDIARLNARIKDLRDSSGILAAVYLVPSLSGDSIEQAATATFEKWKLGKIGEDNGLLIIASIGDRRARIETGYGLEGDIPDAVAKRLLDNNLLPAFRENRYADGLDSTLTAVAMFRTKDPSTLSSEQKWTAFAYRQAASGSILSNPGLWPFYAWLLALLFIPMAGRAWRWAAQRPLDHSVRPSGAKALLHIVLGPGDSGGFPFGSLIRLFLCVNPGLFIAIGGYQLSQDARAMAIMLGTAVLGAVTSALLSFADPKRRDRVLGVVGYVAAVIFAGAAIIALLGFGGWALVYHPSEFFDVVGPILLVAMVLAVIAKLLKRVGGGGSGGGSSSSWDSSSFSSWDSSSSSSSSSSISSSSDGGSSGGGGASGSW